MTQALKTLLAATTAAFALAGSAKASVIFSQDFSSGLTSAESVGGRFVVSDGVVGHVGGYLNNESSFYQVRLDLSQLSDALFTFDWTSHTEINWDGWNVLVAPVGTAFDPAHPFTGSPSVYNRFVSALGAPGMTGIDTGKASFNLAPFLGQQVDLRIQFASDFSNVGRGVAFDNLVLTGTQIPVSAVPEPGTWALMITGVGLAGAALRRRHRLAEA
jgi:hypothetical protein